MCTLHNHVLKALILLGFLYIPFFKKIGFSPLFSKKILENVFLNHGFRHQNQPFVDSFKMIS